MNVEFSTDGKRALIFGGINSVNNSGQIYEYRHDLYARNEIFSVFTDHLGNGSSQGYLTDASWRPGCDQGLIIGGVDTLSRQAGYVIYFTVTNGVPC